MRPLIRLRLLIGVAPYTIDRLVDIAFGPWSAAVRRAAPLGATLLAAGIAGAGLTLAHSAFSDYSAYLPWGVAAIAEVTLAFILLVVRRRAEVRPSVVPPLIGLLVVISIVPLMQSGAELIVTRTSASDFVDRRTGTDVSLLDLHGLALRVPFAANDPSSTEPAWFYAVRDDPADERVALVRSPLSLATLDQRPVTARVIEDQLRVAGGERALASRGWLKADEGGIAGDRYLVEVAGASGGVRELGSLSDLRTADAGSLVRITLRFRGVSIATCEARGSACDARGLANGHGGFVQVADDPSGAGGPILVQTTYPATDAPIHAVGGQVRAEAQIDSLLTLPWVGRLFGWGHVVRVAYIAQDPHLPVNRFWLGPLILLAIGGTLLVGRRLGYPLFVLEAPGARSGRQRRVAPPAPSPAPPVLSMRPSVVSAIVSGRLAQPRGGPMDVEEAPGELRAPASLDTGAVLVVRPEGATLEMQLPVESGALTSLERGEVQWLVHRRPALWIHWFGSDARLVFADRTAMSQAEAILKSFVG